MGCESGNPSDWLPAGWKVRVKVRSSGRKDKYYVNPTIGLKFSSKPEVLRYLETSQKNNKLDKPNEIDDVVQNLPPGWVKEIRTVEKRGRVKRDTYYIDPVSGRQFRSMDEVFLYLKSTDSGKLESKQERTREKAKKMADKSADEDQLLKLGADEENDIKSGKLPVKPVQVSKKELQNGGRRHSRRLAEIKLKENASEYQSLQSGLVCAEEKKHVDMPEMEGSEQRAQNSVDMPEMEGLEQREKKSVDMPEMEVSGQREKKSCSTGHNKKTNLKRKWASDLPRRTSKRLARVEADPSLEVKTSEDICQAVPSNEAEINFEAKSARFDSSNEHRSVGVSSKENDNGKQHFDSILSDLLSDPCIEFAIKTLTGVIPIEDIIKVNNSCSSPASSSLNQTSAASSSSSMLPLVNNWPDPCFEFAVKTLTSNMPAERKDSSSITFQQPLSSSELPNFRLDNNLCPSNYSFTQSHGNGRKPGEQKGGLL